MRSSELPRESLDVTAIIDISLSKKTERYAIMKALKPDNINFPKGLSMKVFSKDNNNNTLSIKFLCSTGIETLINTTDEVLEHISLAKNVISDD
jgi:hypothetical protein